MFATISTGSVKQKKGVYNGGSFLSQSGRFFNIESAMASVTVTDNYGHHRNIPLN
jgi:hypothetical protein